MKFTSAERRTATSVFARDVVVGDTLCEQLNRYCETRCIDPVIREEGRVSAVSHYAGFISLWWRTPYGESKHADVPSYTPVMVIR